MTEMKVLENGWLDYGLGRIGQASVSGIPDQEPKDIRDWEYDPAVDVVVEMVKAHIFEVVIFCSYL